MIMVIIRKHKNVLFRYMHKALIKLFIILIVMMVAGAASAQPYLDAVNLRFQQSPKGKSSAGANKFTYLNASINIPLVLKKDSSIIVFSPSMEHWSIKADSFLSEDMGMHSNMLPVSLIKPINRSWALTFSVIPRWNGHPVAPVSRFQMGGAVLATYKKRPGLAYKFGLYYNSEFSGPFFMPLLGIDWQIDERNNLFGVLPGILVFEHKLSKYMFWGFNFRSITNTYSSGYIYSGNDPVFLRIQDTQAEIYTDLYLTDNIVLNFAAGHSFARKYREGKMHVSGEYFHDQKMVAGFYGKISFAYRIRFR